MKTCEDVMSLELKCVNSTATALEAARLMRENSIGFLPVCDPQTGRLVGVITDRDLVTRMCAVDGIPSLTDVVDIATTRPAVCGPKDSLRAAENVMTSVGISRVVIIDDDGHPIGIVSLTDVIMAEGDRRAARTVRGVLERESGGPRAPLADLHLTPSEPGDTPAGPGLSARAVYDGSRTASSRDDLLTSWWAGGRRS